MQTDVQLITNLAGKSAFLDILGIFFAQYLAYVLGILFIILLLMQKGKRRRWQLFFYSFLSLLLSWGLIDLIINRLFFRDRPFVVYDITPLIAHGPTASFPSTHAIFFFVLATITTLAISRRWGAWFFAAAALIGLARVYAGVHFPLDIAAGALIGVVSPFIIQWVLPQVKQIFISEKESLPVN